MIAALFHLLLVLLAVYCLFSYVVCGYVAFMHADDRLRKVAPGMKVMLWLLSPLVILDVIIERATGRSFMS